MACSGPRDASAPWQSEGPEWPEGQVDKSQPSPSSLETICTERSGAASVRGCGSLATSPLRIYTSPQFLKTHMSHISHFTYLHISSTYEKLMPPWNPVLLPGVSSRLPPPGHSSGSTSPHGHLTRAHFHMAMALPFHLDFREPILDHNFSLQQVSLFCLKRKGKSLSLSASTQIP